MHVLIVDDDPLAGELAAAILAEAGHDCRMVDSAAAALAHLAAEQRQRQAVGDDQRATAAQFLQHAGELPAGASADFHQARQDDAVAHEHSPRWAA